MSDNQKDRAPKHAKIDEEDRQNAIFIPKQGDSSQLRRVNPSKEHSVQKYVDMSKPELQKWLRHNGQLVSGRKHDLLLRCIDGQLNGRIPGCPACHHGQMQYDYSHGQYICNGYFDDMSRTPIRCGHTASEVKREPWRDVEKDTPAQRGGTGDADNRNQQRNGGDKSTEPHHKEHPDHHHSEHTCKVEANHPLVDLLEDMAYYHSVIRDQDWGYRARAFKAAANAVEQLGFEVKNARILGDSNSEHHVERIGKSSAEAMQSFLDSGKQHCPQLEDLRSKVEGKGHKD
jgi:hypothetical protein